MNMHILVVLFLFIMCSICNEEDECCYDTTKMSGYSIKCRWLIIGGMTPTNTHKKEWVDNLIKKYKNIPIFLKDSLHYPVKIKQSPVGLN